MNGHRVGGEVDAYCTKCKMLLGHTIVAMVETKIARVRCNTCMGEHAYRASVPGTKRAAKTDAAAKKPRATATRAKKPEALPFETLFEGRDLSAARRYSPKERFAEDEVIEHPTFGLGLVQAVREDKIDAVFKQGPKTLIHKLGEPVAFSKSPRSAAGPSTAAADKPPPGQPAGLHVVHSHPPTELPVKEVAEEEEEDRPTAEA